MGKVELAECHRSSDSCGQRPDPWVNTGKNPADGRRRVCGQVCAGRAAFGESIGGRQIEAQIAPLEIGQRWMGLGDGFNVLIVGVGRGRRSRAQSRGVGDEVYFEVGLVDPHAVEVGVHNHRHLPERAKKRRALEEEPRRPRAPKKLEDDVGKSLCVKELLLQGEGCRQSVTTG